MYQYYCEVDCVLRVIRFLFDDPRRFVMHVMSARVRDVEAVAKFGIKRFSSAFDRLLNSVAHPFSFFICRVPLRSMRSLNAP